MNLQFHKDQKAHKNSNILLTLFYIYLFSLLINLLVVVFFLDMPIALDDMYQYDMLARSLANGNGFRWYSKTDVEVLQPYYSQFLDIDTLNFPTKGIRTTFRAPGYPFFLAAIYVVTPDYFHFQAARIIQALLIAILAPLSAAFAYKFNSSYKTVLITGIFSALYPILLFYPIGLASENLYILLGILTLLVTLLSVEKNNIGWTIIAAILGGLTLLTRSIFAIYIILAGIWIARSRKTKRVFGLYFILIAIGICVPWAIRNSFIMNKVAFVENSLGYNLFIGYHPEGNGGFVSDIAIIPMQFLDDVVRDQFCMKETINFIKEIPAEIISRFITRLGMFSGVEVREFLYFYTNNQIGNLSTLSLLSIYTLLIFPWSILIIFSPIGLWFARNNKNSTLILIFAASYCLPHLLILAEPRFHLALVPVLIPFAMDAFHKLRNKNHKMKMDIWFWLLLPLYLITLISFVINIADCMPYIIATFKADGNILHYSY